MQPKVKHRQYSDHKEKIKWEDQVLLAKSEVFKVFSLLGHVESFKLGQILMPVIQLDYGKILVGPMQEDVSDLPSWLWDWEGIWFFEKNVCFSACVLALFQLHALHWMPCTSTLLSEFEGLEDKGCSSLPRVWFTKRQHQWWPWHARAIVLLHHSSLPTAGLLLTRTSLFSFLFQF